MRDDGGGKGRNPWAADSGAWDWNGCWVRAAGRAKVVGARATVNASVGESEGGSVAACEARRRLRTTSRVVTAAWGRSSERGEEPKDRDNTTVQGQRCKGTLFLDHDLKETSATATVW